VAFLGPFRLEFFNTLFNGRLLSCSSFSSFHYYFGNFVFLCILSICHLNSSISGWLEMPRFLLCSCLYILRRFYITNSFLAGVNLCFWLRCPGFTITEWRWINCVINDSILCILSSCSTMELYHHYHHHLLLLPPAPPPLRLKPLDFFRFRTYFLKLTNIFRHLIGLLGRVISPTQGLYLHKST
jgi:hypothetical protein